MRVSDLIMVCRPRTVILPAVSVELLKEQGPESATQSTLMHMFLV